MENIQKERHSWIKFGILMFFMFVYGMLTVTAGDGEINLNFDDPNVVMLLKILQAVSATILFILPAILISVLWTKSKIAYLGIITRPSVATLIIAGVAIILANPLINWLAEVNQHMHLPDAFSGVENG
jgi:hypothetical protein